MFHVICIDREIASDTNNSQPVPVILVHAYYEIDVDTHGIYY